MADPNPPTGQRSEELTAEDLLVDSFFPPIPFDDKEAMEAAERPKSEKAHELMDKDPTLPFISAYIIAGDILSGERAMKMMEAGVAYERAIMYVGSYARLDVSVRAQEAGYLNRDELLEELPDLWRGSDPDDCDPRFLTLWHEAWVRNGRKSSRTSRPSAKRRPLIDSTPRR